MDFLRAEPHGGTVAPGRMLHLLLTFPASRESTSFGLPLGALEKRRQQFGFRVDFF